MSLTLSISDYIQSWDGHTEVEGQNFIALQRKLNEATIDEINTEYNILTQQSLWTPALNDLFFDELQNRLLNDTTFAISTTWRRVEDWRQNPFLLIRVSFEDTYEMIEGDGTIISNSGGFSGWMLNNNDFSDTQQEEIIRFLLHNNVLAELQLSESKIELVSLEVDGMRLFLGKDNLSPKLRIKAKVIESDDFTFIRQMYISLQTNQPGIIDLYPLENLQDLPEEEEEEE